MNNERKEKIMRRLRKERKKNTVSKATADMVLKRRKKEQGGIAQGQPAP
jgi:hypothetical protein